MNDFLLILTLTAIVSIVLILFILITGMYERNKLEKLYSLETNKLKNDFYKKYKREVTKKDLIFAQKKLNSTKSNKKYKRKETKKDLIFTQKKLNSMNNGSNNLNDMLTWLIYYDLLKNINEYNDMSNFEYINEDINENISSYEKSFTFSYNSDIKNSYNDNGDIFYDSGDNSDSGDSDSTD